MVDGGAQSPARGDAITSGGLVEPQFKKEQEGKMEGYPSLS